MSTEPNVDKELDPTAPAGPFVIKQILDPNQIAKDDAINPNDLQNAFLKQSGYYHYYARLKMDAMRQYERAKAAFELLESKLDHAYRITLTEEAKTGGSKVTEAAVKATVTNDKRWWAANKAQIDAKAIDSYAKDTLEGFKQRKDMLIQAGADARQERQAEIRTMIGSEGSRGLMSPAVRAAAEAAARSAEDLVEESARG